MTAPDNECCLNCQTKLEGPFCSQCGQAKSARLNPIKDWIGDFSGAFLKLDSRLLRTVKRILLQPGQATLDFANGKRVPYSGPLRIFIVVSAISIATMTLHGALAPDNVVADPGNNLGVPADADYQKRVQFLFPFFNLLSPLVTAGILALFQRKQFFQLHLAFSLHFWTFMIAIATPLIFIPPTSIWVLVVFACLSIAVTWYFFVAHSRVYAMAVLNRILIGGVILSSVPIATIVITLLLAILASTF